MSIAIGNAPCSWGVEFADDTRNPAWESVLQQCSKAGYEGIELGPIGYMPEDSGLLKEKYDQYQLTLIGGVIFQPFHDHKSWHQVMANSIRTCQALVAHGAQQLVLIDSISPQRAATAGRPKEAIQLNAHQWNSYVDRIRTIAKMAYEEYGLTASIHSHAGGFMDFEQELRRLLAEIDEQILKICLDTGHCWYAGFDPVAFMQQHIKRISYLHFKDIDPQVHTRVIQNRTGFYQACAEGVFCNLGEGMVEFNKIKQILDEHHYTGWCTVEQDCDPTNQTSPMADALKNRHYLQSIGF